MSDSVTVRVPLEARYRVLAPELASKYAELIGGSAAEARSLSEALEAALEKMGHSAGADAHVDLLFRAGAGGVEVDLRCGTHSAVIKQPLPARKT
jgi:hypothetical protein